MIHLLLREIADSFENSTSEPHLDISLWKSHLNLTVEDVYVVCLCISHHFLIIFLSFS